MKSPDVAADGRVTFRLRAPNAKEVDVTLAGTHLTMQKDENGVWTATSDALKPDYYTYSLVVDGTSMNDPNDRDVQTSFGSFQSMFVVPGPDPWLPHAGVPHGAITRHTFHSAVAGDDRDFLLYTPPGYDARRPQPYPVFYLLHGLGDDAARWMNFGGAPAILDNLIAEKKAVPMVLVTTLGYGVNNGPAGAQSPQVITGYTDILINEVMPAVDKAYNVAKNRDERAIAGLSMGGAETLYTAFNHLEQFAWIGSFSGAFVMLPGANAGQAPPPASRGNATDNAAAAPPAGRGRGGEQTMDASAFAKNFPTLDAKANARIKMLWIVCGTSDSLIGVNRQLKDWLKSKDVHYTEQEVPDMAHVWPLWRQNFTDMAQKVFKTASK